MRAQEQDRHLDQVPDAVGGGAVQDVGEEAVAVRRHRDEVDLLFLGDANQLGRRIAHREPRVDGEAAADEVGAQASRYARSDFISSDSRSFS